MPHATYREVVHDRGVTHSDTVICRHDRGVFICQLFRDEIIRQLNLFRDEIESYRDEIGLI
jgi:hypothetical protein